MAIRYAEENSTYIIEDDYDSESRYIGSPIAPLHTMGPIRVVYVGTFSKIIFPALRIGYVIVPRELQERWRYLRIHSDVQNPLFEQATLAEFMQSRRFGHQAAIYNAKQIKFLIGQWDFFSFIKLFKYIFDFGLILFVFSRFYLIFY